MVKKSLKSVTCMAFGYAFLLMVMSEVLPVTAPLMLTVAFFVPFMDRRSFLTLILIQSAYATLMTLIYRDALRAAFLGIDILHLAATTVLLLTGSLEALPHIPGPMLLAAGITATFTSCFIIDMIQLSAMTLIMQKVGFYRRIGKICPREWSIWHGRP